MIQYAVLTDIQGLEDHLGDMDFKVAGTEAGITAFKWISKSRVSPLKSCPKPLIRLTKPVSSILGKMMEVIAVPNPDIKTTCSTITTIKVPVDKIGAIIGPGGKNIRALQEETKTKIDIGDDGTVFIAASGRLTKLILPVNALKP